MKYPFKRLGFNLPDLSHISKPERPCGSLERSRMSGTAVFSHISTMSRILITTSERQCRFGRRQKRRKRQNKQTSFNSIRTAEMKVSLLPAAGAFIFPPSPLWQDRKCQISISTRYIASFIYMLLNTNVMSVLDVSPPVHIKPR